MVKTVLETLEEMESINLEHLTNPIHREFVKDTLKAADQCDAIKQQLPPQLAALQTAYDNEVQASWLEETYQRLTSELGELVAKRTAKQTAVKSWLRAQMDMDDPQVVGGATLLFGLAHRYDLHAGQNYDEQTALINSFITDVESKYMELVELTGLTELFEGLKQLNEAVCDKVFERDDAAIGKGVGLMRECRIATDSAWRELRRAVNAYAYAHDYAGYSYFIGHMNVQILRYKRVHLDQPTQGPEAIPGEGTVTNPDTTTPGETTTPDETTPTKYWLTLKFADNTQEDREYAEGETIEYPTPTTGYRWPASAPTVMPAHDVTVTEERNPNQPPPATGGGESGFD